VLSAQFLADLSHRDSINYRDNVARDFLLCRFSGFVCSDSYPCGASRVVAPLHAWAIRRTAFKDWNLLTREACVLAKESTSGVSRLAGVSNVT
jgi:hypothetical protein